MFRDLVPLLTSIEADADCIPHVNVLLCYMSTRQIVFHT